MPDIGNSDTPFTSATAPKRVNVVFCAEDKLVFSLDDLLRKGHFPVFLGDMVVHNVSRIVYRYSVSLKTAKLCSGISLKKEWSSPNVCFKTSKSFISLCRKTK